MPKLLQWDSDWEELKIPTRERVVDWERLGITGEWRKKVLELLHEIDILEEKLARKEKILEKGKAIIKEVGKATAKDTIK